MGWLEVLVGGLLALGGALGGAWLQNRHDAKQRERERQMNLRKEVYLEAAEGIFGLQAYLGGLADPDRPMPELAESVATRPGWQNKIHVVASLPTIAAFAAADAYFVSASLDAIPLRYKIDQDREELSGVRERRSQLSQYQGYLHTGLQSLLEQQTSPALLSDLRQRIDNAQGTISELLKKERELSQRVAEQTHKLLDESVRKVARHRILTARALLALRDEIDLPLSRQDYLELVERTNSEAVGSFDRLLEESNSGGPGLDS